MIYGEIKDIEQYRGISENLDKAIDYILSGEYKNGVPGKNVIDGEKLYFNCPKNPKTKELEDGFFEGHKQYIDIHVVIDGEENLGFTPRPEVTLKQEYNEVEDYELYDGEIKQLFHLTSERFVMFFPDEPHMALLKVGEVKEIKKVIFKVLVK